jgi:ABC-type molybdate transport system substrate-binding protein
MFKVGFAALLLAGSICTAQAAEVRVISPGVISNSGLKEVAAEFTKKTGVKVTIVGAGLGQIVSRIKTETPASDVVMLPMDLMGRLSLDKGLVPGSFTPLGRVEIGLFKKPSAPMQDISTTEKLIAAMKTASVVFYSDPVSGSMQAGMSDRMVKRPDFAGIHSQPIKGDAEPALKRGEGDDKAMGLGLIHGVHGPDNKPTDNPYLIGMLPAELGMHMDMATGINVRAPDPKSAREFVDFATSPEMRPVWLKGGTDRY